MAKTVDGSVRKAIHERTPHYHMRLFERFRRLMKRIRALLSLPDALDMRLSQVQGELERQLEVRFSEVQSQLERRMDQSRIDVKAELSSQLSFSLHDFETSLSEQKEQSAQRLRDMILNDLTSQLDGVMGEQSEKVRKELGGQISGLHNSQFEMTNRLIHLDTSLQTTLNDQKSQIASVQNTQFETTNRLIHLDTSLHTRLNTLENERLPSITEDIHQLTALLFRLHASMKDHTTVDASDSKLRHQRASPEPFQAILDQARKDFPRIFRLWLDRLDATEKALRETKIGNAAHPGDSASRVFRSFVELNASGRLLDVGCGVHGLPYYLASYPRKLVSGIDPLQPYDTMDFEFVRGISEYLPWPDECFSTVVSATSLDHCLSLDKSLAEIRRVLRPGGRFLLWIASVAGAQQYLPDRQDFAPADRFHLFHFDASWFEPVLEDAFSVVDRVELRKKEYSHVIYSLMGK